MEGRYEQEDGRLAPECRAGVRKGRWRVNKAGGGGEEPKEEGVS